MEETMPVIPQQIIFIILALELLTAIPAGLSLKRIGFSPWWALLCFFPFFAIIGLWALAFIRWPQSVQPQP
jgi:hypothetical protein